MTLRLVPNPPRPEPVCPAEERPVVAEIFAELVQSLRSRDTLVRCDDAEIVRVARDIAVGREGGRKSARAYSRILTFCDRYGLTPASRTRLQQPGRRPRLAK